VSLLSQTPADVPEPLAPIGGRIPGLDTVLAGSVGLIVLGIGLWTLLSPAAVGPARFLPGAGAASIGVGLGLLLALLWRDALATVLVALLVAGAVHAVTQGFDAWPAAVLAVPVVPALWWRLRRLGYVLGHVRLATTPELAGFVAQKTVALDTHRRSGQAVSTPVSIAVDGDRAVVRSFEKAGKTRRLRHDPGVQVAPSTARGTPTGPTIHASARRLDGAEARQAARLLRRKYPLLHGVLVPLAHRVGRRRTGRTVHFELVPDGGRTGRRA
jgi:PPOX class probable F420-dependent enzyme